MRIRDVISRKLGSKHQGILRQPKPARRRTTLRPFTERLEDRLAPAGAAQLISAVLPLYPVDQDPYGVAQDNLPAAEVSALYHLILNREPDAVGQAYWAGLLQSGTSPSRVARNLLRSPDYAALLVESYYQNYLERPADSRGLATWTRALTRGADPTAISARFIASAEYSRLHPGSTAFVQALYGDVLGRPASAAEVRSSGQALARGVGRRAVAAAVVTSNESLAGAISGFYRTFLQRAAAPAELSHWLARARRSSLPDVLAQIVGTGEFQFLAASGTAGKASDSFFRFNQYALASDPVTDSVAAGGVSATAGLVPMDSPWKQAVVFPSVPYGLTQTASAAQPTLTLPSNLIGSVNLAQGGTLQTWFQAKNPGVLMSETLPTTGSTGTGSYTVPLIYINAGGKLVAGLFDQNPISIIPHQSPLSWQDSSGQTQIGAANSLVSQVGVLDNTWHHVALVFSAQSQSLYVDGVLQGSSQPLVHQTNSGLTTSSGTLSLPLNQTPSAGQFIQGTISEGNSNAAYGPGSSVVIATFQGWLPSGGGSASLSLTQVAGSNPSPSVLSVTYNAPGAGRSRAGQNAHGSHAKQTKPNGASASSASLSFVLSGSNQSANALTVEVSYPTPGGSYSFQPASSSTYSTPVSAPKGPSQKVSFGAATGATMGGTIVPEPTSELYPVNNYPQGFVGTLDEVALWNTMLTQSQVQSAMAGPVLPSQGTGLLPGNLVAYFPFTQNVQNTTNQWPNSAPNATSVASGPISGVTLASVSSTNPTDPFPDATRLAGGRAWGLHLATPLASPSLTLKSGEQVVYKVGLAVGDQLAISLPEAQDGFLTLVTRDDLGRVSNTIQLSPNSKQYLPATRTGTYELTLTWTGSGNQNAGVVNFGLLPGPLNSLMELFTGYVQNVSLSQTNTVYAYSDPNLPGINPTVGTSNATAPASYWPLWSDSHYFPAASNYTPADLNKVYQALVAALKNQGHGLTDFSNLIGAPVTSPADLQQYLKTAYQTVFQSAPPTPPDQGPFPVTASATAGDAVYQFLYNANLMRAAIYPVLNTSLPNWVQRIINTVDSKNSVPATIAATISEGQTSQVHSVSFSITQPSTKQSVGSLLLDGVLWAAAGVLAALPGLDEAAGEIVLAAAAIAGGGASLGESFVGNAYASGSQTITYNVPVTAITNSELNYATLDAMATSINSGALEQWNNIADALANPVLIQSVMSNYGLLKAFQTIGAQPLDDPAMDPVVGITTSLSRTAWHEMIPATFTWTPIQPYAFPTGNGQTNDWAVSGPYPTNGKFSNIGGITNADFNKDGKLDVALANESTSDVSVLLGNGDGSFQSPLQAGLNGAHQASGITSGDFNNDGIPDLAVANISSSDVSILLGIGNGRFQTAIKVGLNHGHGAAGLVARDFNKDGNLDLAVANQGSSDVSILLGLGTGHFSTATTVSLSGAHDAYTIDAGDFNYDGNLDLAVANPGSKEVSVLIGDGSGQFQSALNVGLSGSSAASGIAVGNLNGLSGIAVTNFSSNSISVVVVENGFFIPSTYALPSEFGNPAAIATLPRPDGLCDLIVTGFGSYVSTPIALFVNRGDGTFYPPIYLPDIGRNPAGVTVGDFLGNGLNQVAVSHADNNFVSLLSPRGVGNTATFLPGTSTSNTPFSGPTPLQSAVDASALNKLLSQMQQLQGGNTASFGPFNQTSLISPGGVTAPSYMAFTSLVYPPNQVPLNLTAPGLFLSVTPATLNETASSSKNLTYTQNGAYLNGWQLQDSNQNPIAPGTLQQLFGTPTISSSGRPVGVNLSPVDPNQPFAAYNGGWYFAAQPVNNAMTTWAEAYFNWGLGTRSYSPRNLVPSLPLTGQLPNSSTLLVSDANISYNVSFQPANDGPPAIHQGVSVDLSTWFNRTGIVKDTTAFPNNGGLDNGGDALSATLLGPTVIANGTQFVLGTPGVNNVISGAGQTIALPAGQFSTLNILGAGMYGNQANVPFTVTYTDGSTTPFTQSMSDWYFSSNNAGEVLASTMAYHNLASGETGSPPVNLYAYAFAINKAKTIKSITLPAVSNAAIVGITLT